MRSREGYLSKREQQIMEILWRSGSASAATVAAGLPDSPSNSTVRTLLKLLEDKGWVRREFTDGKAVYFPVKEASEEGRNAIQHVLDVFFRGSVKDAVAALMDQDSRLTPEELSEVRALIAEVEEKAR